MKKQDHRKALKLSVLTVGYNIVEGVVAVSFGVASGSSALLGFGLDSFAESLSGSIMIWRFARHGTEEEEERKEQRAYKLVGLSFFVLGAYVLYEAVTQLLSGEAPEQTIAGVVIAMLSLLIMPFLFLAKNRLGKKIGSSSLVADSKQTFACIMMSVTLLVGAGINYVSDIWWADPVAAIIIAIMLLREGYEIRKEGKQCC